MRWSLFTLMLCLGSAAVVVVRNGTRRGTLQKDEAAAADRPIAQHYNRESARKPRPGHIGELHAVLGSLARASQEGTETSGVIPLQPRELSDLDRFILKDERASDLRRVVLAEIDRRLRQDPPCWQGTDLAGPSMLRVEVMLRSTGGTAEVSEPVLSVDSGAPLEPSVITCLRQRLLPAFTVNVTISARTPSGERVELAVPAPEHFSGKAFVFVSFDPAGSCSP